MAISNLTNVNDDKYGTFNDTASEKGLNTI